MQNSPAPQTLPFDAERVRAEFPSLTVTSAGLALAYLDNASTSHKPQVVLDAVANLYREACGNVHRGVHRLSNSATAAFERTRDIAREFLNAPRRSEIVFTRGTTESINLVASSFGRHQLSAHDEVLVTALEHHSNLVPWQQLCAETGATLRALPIDETGALRLDRLDEFLSEKTKLVAVSHVSNSLGTVCPIEAIIAAAKRVGATTLIDGAQAAPHLPIDVTALDCDFYTFSGHKVFGPTGTGVLWGRHEILESMPPWQGGGDMIESVTLEGFTYREPPYRFEAGTPNIAGVVGLGAALEWLQIQDREGLERHERQLVARTVDGLAAIERVRLIGTAADRIAVVAFVVDGFHAHDVATSLDFDNVAIRSGHHCTQPVMTHFGIESTARASFAAYNTIADVDRLLAGVKALTGA